MTDRPSKPRLRERLRAWKRLVIEKCCPECSSDGQVRDGCRICYGYDIADRGIPSPTQLDVWKQRWRARHGLPAHETIRPGNPGRM